MGVKVIPKITRGCGERVKNGLYLFFDATMLVPCDRLPFEVPGACPICGEGLRQFRSVRVINPRKFFGNFDATKCTSGCPVCFPPEHGGMMWVGAQYYTPDSFAEEARKHGISKRIPNIPENLKPGDLVFFAHPKGYDKVNPNNDEKPRPGVFMAARLTEYQKVLSNEDAENADIIADLEARGVVPVIESENEEDNPPVASRGQSKLEV